MDTINKLSNWMLILIDVLALVRVGIYFLYMMFNLDEKNIYIKKIKNCLIAVIIAFSVLVIKNIVEYYFLGILV